MGLPLATSLSLQVLERAMPPPVWGRAKETLCRSSALVTGLMLDGGGPSKTACCTFQSSLQAPHRPPAFCSLVWADDSPPDILFLRQEPSLLTHSPHGVPIDGCSHSFVHQASYLAVNFWGVGPGMRESKEGLLTPYAPRHRKAQAGRRKIFQTQKHLFTDLSLIRGSLL